METATLSVPISLWCPRSDWTPVNPRLWALALCPWALGLTPRVRSVTVGLTHVLQGSLPHDGAGQSCHTDVMHGSLLQLYFVVSPPPQLGLPWARPDASRVARAAAGTHAGVGGSTLEDLRAQGGG